MRTLIKRFLSIVVGTCLCLGLFSLPVYAQDGAESVLPVIEALSDPDMGKAADGTVECTMEATLSAPLPEDVEIVWWLNWTQFTMEDTQHVGVDGETSTFRFLVKSSQECLVRAQLLQGGEPLAAAKSAPVFKTYEAPEGSTLVESLSGLPEVMHVGETAMVTAKLSQKPTEGETVRWIVDSGYIEENADASIVTEGDTSVLTLRAQADNVGPHVLYAAVIEDEAVTSSALQQFVVDEDILEQPALQVRPDSPVPAKVEPLTEGGCIVTGIPISTAEDMTPVSKAVDIFVVPPRGDIAVLDTADEAVAPESPFATGQKIRVQDAEGQTAGEGEVIVRGDVNGTGMLTIAQLTRMAQDLTKALPLEGVYLQAGDLTGSGRIGIGDLVLLAKMMQQPEAR